ncbi:patatin-like phospholipase [Tamaricihabitans halophyticus]|uniref:Patatin-like phospholipase n=1 Tax=Tamaricihabitans halophyticus TaxID=1262583 RepID=A0A4R2R7B7_9PSEU|nr:patatin-like phospholipase family protein [Tamaricihabitans halophyticus]TCP55295.1 patatin-like phospholipase [Tamaricihabitans halophyticus]
MTDNADPVAAIMELGLDDPARYVIPDEHASLRKAPAEVDREADPEEYRAYADRSCDLTMRGGATSAVIYPLAVCALAQRYVFRSVGGASAGAIVATATAAAEYGRSRATPNQNDGNQNDGDQNGGGETPAPDGSVSTGFAGLAELMHWLISGSGAARWRLAELFQPDRRLHRLFRLLIATMQDSATTGRSRLFAIIAGLLLVVGPLARCALVVLALGWLVAPTGLAIGLGVDQWSAPAWWLTWPLAALAAGCAIWALWYPVRRIHPGAVALALPLVPAIWLLVAADSTTSAWLSAAALAVLCWLVTSFAVLAVFAAIYLRASWPALAETERFDFGMVRGAEPYRPNWVDRMVGLPRGTGVPPLATWLADRIDDLAGIPVAGHESGERRALTFGDLWLGPTRATGAELSTDEWRSLADSPGERAINLELMTTDLNAGRPFRLPFEYTEDEHDRWQFCADCLRGLLPERAIRQMSEVGTSGWRCPRHVDSQLYWLPDPWDVPVILGARLSLSMPGLICAVPLYQYGRVHWFSDGGITSNFPIHFFDSLLPRWPTFGLSLDTLGSAVGEAEQVHLPEQDDARAAERWSAVGSGATGLLGQILDTFLSWRDTLQSALPGFRGRIANVRQGAGEGSTNLLMPPETIATIARRGYLAGAGLVERFTETAEDDEASGFTQTDRYRWIRMRLALREYRTLALQARARAPLYLDRAGNYPIPAALAGWFAEHDREWPLVEPYGTEIAGTFTALAALAEGHLAEPFDGAAPVNPVLRLNPPD